MEAIKGAIIGDIVGSRFEFNNIKNKNFDLFGEGCKFTDDTVMTIAIADATKNNPTKDGYIDTLKKWGVRYPNAGYGYKFYDWVLGKQRRAYNSYGNGSAMRISAVAEDIDTTLTTNSALKELKKKVMMATKITHNHPEGIKGAMAVAELIWYANKWRRIAYKLELPIQNNDYKEWLGQITTNTYGYDITESLDIIRQKEDMQSLQHSEACQDTVPIAIRAFIESESFEDCIRNAVSVGGDSDTIAAIAGSIAGAYYGVPDEIWNRAKMYLPSEMKRVINLYKEN